MSAWLLLDPAPLPDGLGIPAEDWQHQGRCLSCGTLCKASLPSEHASGYGPRLTGFVGEMAGMVGASRSAVQALRASVCSIALSTGAIQKMVERVSEAIGPHDTAIGEGGSHLVGELH